MKIFDLTNEVKSLRSENEKLKAKYETLLKAQCDNPNIFVDDLIAKINELELELVSTKTELAMLKEENLVPVSLLRKLDLQVSRTAETAAIHTSIEKKK